MITAMTYLFIILVIATAMVVKTVNLLFHDGRGPAAPPSSHFQDPQFASPATNLRVSDQLARFFTPTLP